MGMMIIRHKVRDYGHWRPLFDGHAEMQKAAGLHPILAFIIQPIATIVKIVVVFQTKDGKNAKIFAAPDDPQEGNGRGWCAGYIYSRFLNQLIEEASPVRAGARHGTLAAVMSALC